MPSSENVALPVSRPARSSRKRLFVAGFLVLMLLIPLVRLIWITSRTATGWETVSRQWRDATVGLVVGKHVPLAEREPAEQAAFWLRETQRIVADEPENAELAMGAALLLDSPSMGFEIHHARRMGSLMPEWDREVIDCELATFEAQCSAQCLAMATKATELQPKEVRWWRLRGTLLFGGGKPGVRVPDWLGVLRQCQQHDPDNALYDYLAASHYWDEAVKPNQMGMSIVDQAKYDLGMKCFFPGQQKPFCAGSGGSGALLLDMLRRSDLPRIEYSAVASGRSRSSYVVGVARDLWRICWYQSERLEREGDLAAALALRRQSVRVSDQLGRTKHESAGVDNVHLLRKHALAYLETLVTQHPELVPAEEAARIAKDAEDAADDSKTYMEAFQRFWTKQQPPHKSFFFASTVSVAIAVSSVLFLLLAGVVVCVAARRLRKTDEPDAARLGVIRHSLAWLVACAATFVVFGLAPAGVISPRGMSWVAAITIDLGYLAVACWLFWRIVIRRNMQFTLRALLILTAVWALLLGILEFCGILPHDVYGFQIHDLTVPPRGADSLPGQWLQESVPVEYGRWNSAFYQWMLWSGPWMTVSAALAILALWHFLRTRRVQAATSIPWRNRWAGRIGCLGRSLLAVAMLWMIAYLWLMPTVVQTGESEYQTKMAYMEKPQEYADALNKMMVEVRAEQSRWKNANPSK
jgi:hypothetical protein